MTNTYKRQHYNSSGYSESLRCVFHSELNFLSEKIKLEKPQKALISLQKNRGSHSTYAE